MSIFVSTCASSGVSVSVSAVYWLSGGGSVAATGLSVSAVIVIGITSAVVPGSSGTVAGVVLSPVAGSVVAYVDMISL